VLRASAWLADRVREDAHQDALARSPHERMHRGVVGTRAFVPFTPVSQVLQRQCQCTLPPSQDTPDMELMGEFDASASGQSDSLRCRALPVMCAVAGLLCPRDTPVDTPVMLLAPCPTLCRRPRPRRTPTARLPPWAAIPSTGLSRCTQRLAVCSPVRIPFASSHGTLLNEKCTCLRSAW
jgi:hypothetical protein